MFYKKEWEEDKSVLVPLEQYREMVERISWLEGRNSALQADIKRLEGINESLFEKYADLFECYNALTDSEISRDAEL